MSFVLLPFFILFLFLWLPSSNPSTLPFGNLSLFNFTASSLYKIFSSTSFCNTNLTGSSPQIRASQSSGDVHSLNADAGVPKATIATSRPLCHSSSSFKNQWLLQFHFVQPSLPVWCYYVQISWLYSLCQVNCSTSNPIPGFKCLHYLDIIIFLSLKVHGFTVRDFWIHYIAAVHIGSYMLGLVIGHYSFSKLFGTAIRRSLLMLSTQHIRIPGFKS